MELTPKSAGILILVAVVAFVIGSRSDLFRDSAAEALNNYEKCRDAGIKAFKADEERYGSNIFEPEFTYSEALNTCLYAGGYSNMYSVCEGGLSSKCRRGEWERWIKDSFTNRKIESVFNMTLDSGDWITGNDEIESYWNKRAQLFGEEG